MKYQYCGLVLNTSEIFPELEPADNGALPDIQIHEAKLGSIPAIARAYGPNWVVNKGEAWWWLEGKIYFRIRPGQIEVDNRNAESALARALLLEAPMIMAMIFNGIFCLNAASAIYNGETVVFCGDASSGRSTAIARLVLRGGKLLTDSLARVDCTRSDGARVVPQGSGALLWPHSLELLGLSEDEGTQARESSLLRRIKFAQAQRAGVIDEIYWRKPLVGSDASSRAPDGNLGSRKIFSRLAMITAGRIWISAAGLSAPHFQWCLKAAQHLNITPAPQRYFDY